MRISPINFTTHTYPATNFYPAANAGKNGQAVNAVSKVNGVNPVGQKEVNSTEKVKPSECQTCKNRKYMDRSNDANVSFKSPTHVSPSASYAAVSAHEGQHVANAVSEGSKPGAQLVSTSVTLKMSVCPECGTPYAEGGTTRSTIRYNESNPYEKERKSAEEGLLKGMNFDAVA